MQTFWKWPVRNLALAAAAVSIAAGFLAVTGWALALASACLAALLAKLADSCYQAACRRARRQAIVTELAAARSRSRILAAPGSPHAGPRRTS